MMTLLGPLTRGQWPLDPKVNSGRGGTGTNPPGNPTGIHIMNPLLHNPGPIHLMKKRSRR